MGTCPPRTSPTLRAPSTCSRSTATRPPGPWQWEVHYTPSRNDVKAAFKCRLLVDASSSSSSSAPTCLTCQGRLRSAGGVPSRPLVECTVTVITEHVDLLPPRHTSSCSLRHDLGELLRKGTGSDVQLVVSGESFTAHKAILASRSPVFTAQFFGHMKETDMVPQLERHDDGIVLAVDLLAAADMYGIERLKSICDDTCVETALAEQHGCSKLKARCVELIAANLDAVMETDGYKHLMARSPLVLNDLLRAVRGKKN